MKYYIFFLFFLFGRNSKLFFLCFQRKCHHFNVKIMINLLWVCFQHFHEQVALRYQNINLGRHHRPTIADYFPNFGSRCERKHLPVMRASLELLLRDLFFRRLLFSHQIQMKSIIGNRIINEANNTKTKTEKRTKNEKEINAMRLEHL